MSFFLSKHEYERLDGLCFYTQNTNICPESASLPGMTFKLDSGVWLDNLALALFLWDQDIIGLDISYFDDSFDIPAWLTVFALLQPSVEEFNYPMPENCAAGNTGVFVNGRELHQKDLDRLSTRGLPITRQKFYIVKISGRVFDEDTGEELDRLGRLAPT